MPIWSGEKVGQYCQKDQWQTFWTKADYERYCHQSSLPESNEEKRILKSQKSDGSTQQYSKQSGCSYHNDIKFQMATGGPWLVQRHEDSL
jgi:hypothetical protein